MKEDNDSEAREIISEFFSAGEKDYTPKEFIAAVHEANADTQTAPSVEGDPETAAAGTEATAVMRGAEPPRTIGPDTRTRAGSPPGWSTEDGEDKALVDKRKQRRSALRIAAVVLGVAGLAIRIGMGDFQLHRTSSPPTSTWDPAAPIETPQLEGVDAKFIGVLRSNAPDSFFTSVSDGDAIADAHRVCDELREREATQNLVPYLPTISSQDLAWFVDTARANYCPKPSGDG
jgi:Protein of unknown function (DUF732)